MSIEAMKQALEALEDYRSGCQTKYDADKVITSLRQAITEAEKQEPVGYWMGEFSKDGGATLYEAQQESVFGRKYRNIPLYTRSPQRQWANLTENEITGIILSSGGMAYSAIMFAQNKLKEKNCG